MTITQFTEAIVRLGGTVEEKPRNNFAQIQGWGVRLNNTYFDLTYKEIENIWGLGYYHSDYSIDQFSSLGGAYGRIIGWA